MSSSGEHLAVMGPRNGIKEGKQLSYCSSFVIGLYGLLQCNACRSLLRKFVLRMEGGAIYSLTIREIFRRFHGVDVGLYTIGPCEVAPGNLAPGTSIGRYSSIYYTVRTIACDYPSSGRFPSGLFSNSAPGSSRLVIGNDVYIGHNAIIMDAVGHIGDGAVIGAGSVVNMRVSPYAVVTGNPARVVRYRFSQKTIDELIESQWWLKSIEELGDGIEQFQKPLEGNGPIR